MKIDYAFHAFWHEYYDTIIRKAEDILCECNAYMASLGKSYVDKLQLDEVTLSFRCVEKMKCRVRPYYIAVRDMAKSPYEPFSLMALVYEIPILESEFIQVPEEGLPTYIGRAILQVIDSQNVPVRIRKQFDRDRFVADVRNFFVNVKGCKL